MPILQIFLQLVILGDLGVGPANEFALADAMMPEHVRSAIALLDDPDFRRREAATDTLFALGVDAVYPLTFAAENGSPEASVRAFDILQWLYRGDHEPTYEAVEQAFQKLKRANNLAIAARALRNIENDSETRQERAIVQIERLGGLVSFKDRNFDKQPLIRPTIEYIALTRSWVGGDAGLQLLGRIEDIRNAESQLYIIRGVDISEESQQNLRAELPFLRIDNRGPARLGVRSNSTQREEDGCVIHDVDPGSAAERAGLKTNDVIIEIDHQQVNSFLNLIQIIEAKEPGDKIPIVFRRGAENHEATAELQAWSKQTRPVEVKKNPS